MRKHFVYLFAWLYIITYCNIVSASIRAPFDLFPLDVIMNHYSETPLSKMNKNTLWLERILPGFLPLDDVHKDEEIFNDLASEISPEIQDKDYNSYTPEVLPNIIHSEIESVPLSEDLSDYSYDEDLSSSYSIQDDLDIEDLLTANKNKISEIERFLFPIDFLKTYYSPYFFLLINEAFSYSMDYHPSFTKDVYSSFEDDFFKNVFVSEPIQEHYIPSLSSIIINPPNKVNDEFDDILDGIDVRNFPENIPEISESELDNFKENLIYFPDTNFSANLNTIPYQNISKTVEAETSEHPQYNKGLGIYDYDSKISTPKKSVGEINEVLKTLENDHAKTLQVPDKNLKNYDISNQYPTNLQFYENNETEFDIIDTQNEIDKYNITNLNEDFEINYDNNRNNSVTQINTAEMIDF